MPTSTKVGSSTQSFPASQGPFDGKLFAWFPISTLPTDGNFYTLTDRVYTGQTLGAWRLIRMVREFVFTKNEGDGTPRTESRKGKTVPLERFYREINPTCSFIAGEQFNPWDLQLGLGADNRPINNAVDQAYQEEFLMSLHAEKIHPMPVEFNLSIPTATTVTNTAGVDSPTGGSIADGDYIYVVTTVTGSAETIYAIGAESSAVTTTGGGSSSITVTWTAATTQPDAYRIYRTADGAAPGTYANPALVAEVAGTILTVVDTLAAANLDQGVPVITSTDLVVQDAAGVTTYVLDTDYTFDGTEGTIKRITAANGGSIGNGEMVKLTFNFSLEAGVQIPIDEGRFSSYHVPLMFIGQRNGTRGHTGMVRMIFDNVDWAKGADSFAAFNELADAGLNFSDVPIDFNESTGRFGEIAVYDEQLDDFTVLNMQ